MSEETSSTRGGDVVGVLADAMTAGTVVVGAAVVARLAGTVVAPAAGVGATGLQTTPGS